jgi:hypothetical protein
MLVRNHDLRNRIASAALAVYLFQGQASRYFPAEKVLYEQEVRSMNFALKLRNDIDKNNDLVKQIVSKYGLLEPNYRRKRILF